MLQAAGMADPVMDMEKITITYPDAAALLADVRAFGGNPLRARPQGLQPRRAWSGLLDLLEQRRAADGRLRLTVEIVYGHAFRAEPKRNSHGEQIIRFEPKR